MKTLLVVPLVIVTLGFSLAAQAEDWKQEFSGPIARTCEAACDALKKEAEEWIAGRNEPVVMTSLTVKGCHLVGGWKDQNSCNLKITYKLKK